MKEELLLQLPQILRDYVKKLYAYKLPKLTQEEK